MKILYLVHSISWVGGGAFFHAFHLAKGMAILGNDVSIMSIHKKNRFRFVQKEYDGITIIESPDLLRGLARSGWDLWNTFMRIIFLRKKDFEIVHCLDSRPAVIFPGLYLKYCRKSKLVIEWLDWFGNGGTASERKLLLRIFMLPIESFFEVKFRKYADASIGLGEPLTARAKQYTSSDKVITIVHGCDTTSLKEYDKYWVREELCLDKNAFIIGYVGRMRDDVILRLTAIVRGLKEKILGKKVYCLLIGNTAFDYSKYLSKDIEDSFISTGWTEYQKVNMYMSSCDVLTLPFSSRSVARNGIWPSKVNDYLSVGRPIISTDLLVLRNLFATNEIGFMVEDDLEMLVEKTYTLLNADELVSKFGKNARLLAESKLNWKSIIQDVHAFYLEIV